MTALRLGGISWNDDARPWSVASFLAGLLGAACAGVIIASQADPSSLNWPLILVPAVAVPLPVLVPRRGIRVIAAIVMVGWCSLTGFSIGLFFAPCLVLMIVAAGRQDA